MTENFLRRWSRLKRDSSVSAEVTPSETPAATGTSSDATAAARLPTVDSLEFSSDFTAFMGDQVEGAVRRAALQKLFHADHFNVMDGLDVYVEDYNSFEPIGEAMLRNLDQAQRLIFNDEPLASVSTGVAPKEAQPSDVTAAGLDQPNANRDDSADNSP